MDDDFKFLLIASEVVHVNAVQWLESNKHMAEVEALMKQMRRWESLARQPKAPTKIEAQKIAKEHGIPLGRGIKDFGFLKLLPHIREYFLKRIDDLRSRRSAVSLLSSSNVGASERSRSSRGVAQAFAEGTTGQLSESASEHGVSSFSGFAPAERSRSPRAPSSVSAGITKRHASESASEHRASRDTAEHGLLRFFKRKREEVDEEEPQRRMQLSSSSEPSSMMACENRFASDSLFPTPTESQSQLLSWLQSSSNDNDAEVKRIRYFITEWNSFAATSHTNVRKKAREVKAKLGMVGIPKGIQDSQDLGTWLTYVRTTLLQQAQSRRVFLAIPRNPVAYEEAQIRLEDVADISMANKFVRQCSEVSDELRTSLVLKRLFIWTFQIKDILKGIITICL